MTEDLEHRSHEERLRNLRLFSLENSEGIDLIRVYKYLKGRAKQLGTTEKSLVLSGGQGAQTGKQDVPYKHEKKLLTVRVTDY